MTKHSYILKNNDLNNTEHTMLDIFSIVNFLYILAIGAINRFQVFT